MVNEVILAKSLKIIIIIFDCIYQESDENNNNSYDYDDSSCIFQANN